VKNNKNLFTSDFKATPYWWEHAPLYQTDNIDLPSIVDVLIVGSGYTGLHAALQTARAGMNTLVLDSQQPGYGCSTRNGGQISTSIKHNYPTLVKRYGESLAHDILSMGQASLDYIRNFIKQENIDCEFEVTGRFHGAHSHSAFKRMAAEIEQPNPAFNTNAFMVSHQDQHTELGTDLYRGGIVFPHFAAVHPAKYHAGTLAKVKEAGARVIGQSTVEAIDSHTTEGQKHFTVNPSRGMVVAKQVVIATNGYTGSITPWHRRRVIPIGSYIIATEEIDADRMQALFPQRRMLTDSRKLVYYYRPSYDHKRIIFGGRVSLIETDATRSGPKLLNELHRLFPQLRDIRISHSWTGTVAYTFNSLMHCGEHNGMHHAMGYCGSGVGMASYLGKCIGEQISGNVDEKIPLSNVAFKTRPFYKGVPWFLAPSIWLYRMRDRTGW